MTRLTQRFTTTQAYHHELARISSRWERPTLPNYDMDPADLPDGFRRHVPVVVLRDAVDYNTAEAGE